MRNCKHVVRANKFVASVKKCSGSWIFVFLPVIQIENTYLKDI